jgi:hypothetical protein
MYAYDIKYELSGPNKKEKIKKAYNHNNLPLEVELGCE